MVSYHQISLNALMGKTLYIIVLQRAVGWWKTVYSIDRELTLEQSSESWVYLRLDTASRHERVSRRYNGRAFNLLERCRRVGILNTNESGTTEA